MTDLIKAIFEAENSGAITLSTRNTMIDTLTKKNRLATKTQASENQTKTKKKSFDTGSGNQKLKELRASYAKLMTQRMKLESERDKLMNELSNKGSSYTSSKDDHIKGNGANVKVKTGDKVTQTRLPANDFKKYKKKIDELSKNIKKCKDAEKKLGDHIEKIQGSATVESVVDVIFEKELAGEITSDERAILMNYLESKISEDVEY